METVILHHLSKTFPGGKEAVKSISLSLHEGEVFGFLGPNGAGKTTTVKLLTGILLPSGGSCRVMNTDPSREPEKSHALSGVVTEHAQMYDLLTGLQNLIFYASVFGIPEEEGRARALIHRPSVLFLDEPTSGLDPESALNVNRLIRSLASEERVTIFLCTHQLRYAQEICTRYGLIDEGSLLAEGTLEELRSRVSDAATLRIRSAGIAPEVLSELSLRQSGEGCFETDIRSEEDIPGIVRRLVEAGSNIYGIETEYPDLEDIYFSLTGKKKEGHS